MRPSQAVAVTAGTVTTVLYAVANRGLLAPAIAVAATVALARGRAWTVSALAFLALAVTPTIYAVALSALPGDPDARIRADLLLLTATAAAALVAGGAALRGRRDASRTDGR